MICEFREEGGLHEGFAAGEGDAAAGGGEDIGVREKLTGELGDGPSASAHHLCSLGTDPFEGLQVVWRNVLAVPATDTLLLLEEDFGLRGQALRIMAPGATEGTALEENRRAHAGTVVQAEFPHLKDDHCPLNVHARSIAQTAVMW